MARNASEPIAWKPRRLRKLDMVARVARLQRNLPPLVREVFAATESRADTEKTPLAPEPRPASPASHQSKFAVLPWEPRGDGANR